MNRLFSWSTVHHSGMSLYFGSVALVGTKRRLHVISKILSLPTSMINDLADEAVTCFACLNGDLPFSSLLPGIPLMRSLLDKDSCLQFFYENCERTAHEVEFIVSWVRELLSDVGNAHLGNLGESSTQSPVIMSGRSSLSFDSPWLRLAGRSRVNETPCGWTMFVTFSKGYPVAASELIQFITRTYGNCIVFPHERGA